MKNIFHFILIFRKIYKIEENIEILKEFHFDTKYSKFNFIL